MNRFECILDQPIGIEGRGLIYISQLLDDTATLPSSQVLWLKHGTQRARVVSYSQPAYGTGLILSTVPSNGMWLSNYRDSKGRHVLALGSLRKLFIAQGDGPIMLVPIECPGRGPFGATRLEISKDGKLVVS